MFRVVILFCLMILVSSVFANDKGFRRAEEVNRFQQSDKVAILVGVSAYNQRNTGFSPLSYAAKDMVILGHTLRSKGFNVIQLTNDQASKSVVVNKIEQATKLFKPGQGTLVFAFSGHGYTEPGQPTRLATYDTLVSKLSQTGLSVQEVVRIIRASKVRRAMLFIDACRNDPTPGRKSGIRKGPVNYNPGSGIQILYSTQHADLSFEHPSIQQGVFSYFLNHGLRGKAEENGVVTFESLARYVEREVPRWTLRSLSQTQQPFSTVAGERYGHFILSARKVPKPEGSSNVITGSQRFMQLTQAALKGDTNALKQLQNMPEFKRLTSQTNAQQRINPQTSSSDQQMQNLSIVTQAVSKDPQQVALAKAMQVYLSNDANRYQKLAVQSKTGNVFAGMILERSYRVGVSGTTKNAVLAKRYLGQKQAAYRLLPNLVAKNDHIAISWWANQYRDSEHYQVQAKAIPLFTKAANKGMAYAQAVLGNAYRNGEGVKENDVIAFKWIKQAADAGITWSQYTLGKMYRDGEGVKKNYPEAMKWYQKAVGNGSEGAMTAIGYMYEMGYGVAKNNYQAVAWYRKGAEAGNDWGQSNLGVMYRIGKGVKKDYKQAMFWFEKAAKQGNTRAFREIGALYDEGQGVTENDYEAVKWYRKAADAGDATGMRNVGWMYRNGTGVKKDYQQAMRWFKKAADKGDTSALTHIGYLYRNGYGVTASDAEAVKWYRKGAEAGDDWGQTNLGWMYARGRGIKQDYRLTMQWYQKAAAQNYGRAFNNIGTLYRHGRGVAANKGEAMKYYRKAYDAGYGWGAKNIGDMYEKGDGVRADFSQAMAWYKKAAEKELKEGHEAVDRLYSYAHISFVKSQQGGLVGYIGDPKLKGSQISEILYREHEAINWYKKAANLGYDRANAILALIYISGKQKGKSSVEVFNLFKKASDQGDVLGKAGLIVSYYIGYGTRKNKELAKRLMIQLDGLLSNSGSPGSIVEWFWFTKAKKLADEIPQLHLPNHVYGGSHVVQ